MTEINLPEKMYFKIGEVAELTDVKPHVLRYWESEFKLFRPGKSRTRQRLYRKKDIEVVFLLKDLLYNQGYTIAGARKKLVEQHPTPEEPMDLPSEVAALPILEEIHSDLIRLRAMLDHTI